MGSGEALTNANLGKFEVINQELVGPVIGADLQRKGIYATLASIVGITIYIGLRFRFAFAMGAIAATLHDILVTLAFLTFFGYELSLNIVAALLTSFYVTNYQRNVRQDETNVPIWVAKRDIPAGTSGASLLS